MNWLHPVNPATPAIAPRLGEAADAAHSADEFFAWLN
jgi:hypothetical protein